MFREQRAGAWAKCLHQVSRAAEWQEPDAELRTAAFNDGAHSVQLCSSQMYWVRDRGRNGLTRLQEEWCGGRKRHPLKMVGIG